MEWILELCAIGMAWFSLYLTFSKRFIKRYSTLFQSAFIWHIVGTMTLLVSYKVGYIPTWKHLGLLYLLELTLFWGALIDKLFYILPDLGVYMITIGGFMYQMVQDGIGWHVVIQMFCMGLGWYILRCISNGGVGYGDIKWLMAISLWLQPYECITLCALSSLLGALYGIYMSMQGYNRSYIPFGPFISIGTILTISFPFITGIYI